VRCELHRATGRPSNVVTLQEQDAVARAMHVPDVRGDADALMRRVSAAARAIDWAGGRFWRRIERLLAGRARTGRPRRLPEPIRGAVLVDDELDIVADEGDAPRDESYPLEVAAAAARLGVPLSRRALTTLAGHVAGSDHRPPLPWSERTRRAFVSLLGSGESVVATVEALEHHGLFSHYLPEWRHVRSLPQRNAFHIYTVDRHLLRTVANADRLVRTVSRPDLLLVGALLHDIGKGYPRDHTEVGMEIVDRVVPRMGFDDDDVAVVRAMVEHHLLLAETATRRDLSDPRTAANAAAEIENLERLHLLRALTEADSLATGPSAWSRWKSSLIDQLVDAVSEDLRGRAVPVLDADGEQRFGPLLATVRQGATVDMEHHHAGEFEVVTVACPDHEGLFAEVSGLLALHRVDVTGAEAWTSADGIAVLRFQILAGVEDPPYGRIRRDLPDALSGRLDLVGRLTSRIDSFQRAYRRATAAAPPTRSVAISNNESDATTMIDVRLPDGPAVLYQLASALASFGVSIRSAKVQTLGHEVVDVFYVERREPGRVPRQLLRSEQDELREQLLAVRTDPERIAS
jgi:[protein-PII] uridylyltransferase